VRDDYKALLFDMGYTLVYFEPPTRAIIRTALRDVGVERSEHEIEAAIEAVWGAYYHQAATATFPPTEAHDRQTQKRLSERLLTELGLPAQDLVTTYRRSIEARFDRPGVVRPYAEVADVLIRLKEMGYRLGIVSNWSWNLRQRVAQAGLADFFEVVWASAYAGCNKPHPAIFHQALEQMGVPPQRALYVGDSYDHDVVGARNAGLDAVLLDREGTAQSPDCPLIRDLRQLEALLGLSQ